MLFVLKALYGFLGTYEFISKHGLSEEFKILQVAKELKRLGLPVDKKWISYLTGLHIKRVERIVEGEEFKWWISHVKKQKPKDVIKLALRDSLTLMVPKLHGRHVGDKKAGRMPLVYEFEEPGVVRFMDVIFRAMREGLRKDEGLQREFEELVEVLEKERLQKLEELWSGKARYLLNYVAFRLMEVYVFNPKPLIESFSFMAEVEDKIREMAGEIRGRCKTFELTAIAEREGLVNDLLEKLRGIDSLNEWQRIALMNKAFAEWIKARVFKRSSDLHKAERQIEVFDEMLVRALQFVLNAYDAFKCAHR
jgi:hypothetical protein